jgi:SAM-dependent methyltransferase
MSGNKRSLSRMQQRAQGWTDDLTLLHQSEAGADHSIDRYSRDFALSRLRKHFPADGALLEFGSSSGYMLEELKVEFPAASLAGSDAIESIVARVSTHTSVPVTLIDITDCRLPSSSLDAVIALNVFEHVEDDSKAASEVARILKPGGCLVIEVPGGPQLYDGYDAYLMHFRRYTRGSLRRRLTNAGLCVIEQSAIGFIAYPGFWLTKKLNRARYGTKPKSDLVRAAIQSSRESLLLKYSIAIERSLSEWISFPFGIRHTAVAVKPR